MDAPLYSTNPKSLPCPLALAVAATNSTAKKHPKPEIPRIAMARAITSYAGPEIEMEDAWLQDQPYLKPSKSSTAPTTNVVEIAERTEDRLVRFQCKICLETASEAVVTPCGHLFCWPCIYMWLSRSSKNSDECPVCKGYVTRDNLTPIYGEGQPPESRRGKDDIPPRPKARREEKHGGKVHHRHAPVPQQSRSRALPHGQTLR